MLPRRLPRYLVYACILLHITGGVIQWHQAGVTPRPNPPPDVDALVYQKAVEQGRAMLADSRPGKGGKRAREDERAARRAAKQVRKAGREYKSPCTEKQRASRAADLDQCCVRMRCSDKYEEWQVRKLMDFWATADIATRRHFVARRIIPIQSVSNPESAEVLVGRLKYEYYMDPPEAILPTSVIGIEPLRHNGQLLRVCSTFFTWVGPSKSMIHQDKVKIQSVHGRYDPDLHLHRPRELPVDTVSYRASMWLRDLAQYYLADPTEEGVVYLPFANRKVVYSLYAADALDPDYAQYFSKGVATYATFCRTWRHDKDLRRKIRLRKWLKFSLCDDCVRYREDRSKTSDPNKVSAIQSAELEHRRFVRAERRSYMDRREEAAHPRKREHVMSIIIDGADQAAYGLPYHRMVTHSTQGKHKIKGHLMGAIVHGRRTYGFVGVDNVKQGTNVTIETLHRVLTDQAAAGPLPEILYLQLDNTAKQCKSRFLFGWLGCLVKWGVFKEVYVSFLPVGHTHEDIDQLFSRLATYLRFHNARSRAELCQAFQRCYHDKEGTRPKAGEMDNVANISDWLEERLATSASTQSRDGLMCFRQFWIHLHKDEPVFRCRENCAQGEKWRGLDHFSKRHHIFREGRCPTPDDLHTVPPAQRPSPPAKVTHTRTCTPSPRTPVNTHTHITLADGQRRRRVVRRSIQAPRARCREVHRSEGGCRERRTSA